MAKDTPNFLQQDGDLIKNLLLRYDFILSSIVGALLLANVYYWLLLKVSNLTTIYSNIRHEPVYLWTLVILLPLTLLLFGFNFALALFSLRAKLGVRTHGGTLFGALIGAFGASCPVCGAFLLSLIGVSAGLSALPFGGLELWFTASFIMGVTAWYSLKTLTKRCIGTDAQGKSCWVLPSVNKKLLLVLGITALFLILNLYNQVTKHDSLLVKSVSALSYGQCTLVR